MNAFPQTGDFPELESVTLVPSSGGKYEITVDDKLLFSKLETRQHIADEDAIALVRQHLLT